MKVLKIIREIIIVLIAVLFMLFLFIGAVVQTSTEYCPPTQDELNNMNIVERYFFGN